MTKSYKPIDLTKLETYSIRDRQHKASAVELAPLPAAGASAKSLLQSLPDYLGASAFNHVVQAIVSATRHDRPVVIAFGAHVVKVGCGPILVDLIRRGVVKALACNGACAIHDAELAMQGATSEEVADTIRDGTFGMVQETLDFFDNVIATCDRSGIGIGRVVGEKLIESKAEYVQHSVFAAAAEADIPITVHSALGTDTVHVSPSLNSAALGTASMLDFRLICDVVSDLGATNDSDGVGGVWVNVGSAVLLPEVFLKAVSVARNMGANLDQMTTANFDMLKHYRPHQNVVKRPVRAGRGFEIIGHHEIMLPLLRQAVIEGLDSSS